MGKEYASDINLTYSYTQITVYMPAILGKYICWYILHDIFKTNIQVGKYK